MPQPQPQMQVQVSVCSNGAFAQGSCGGGSGCQQNNCACQGGQCCPQLSGSRFKSGFDECFTAGGCVASCIAGNWCGSGFTCNKQTNLCCNANAGKK